MKFLAYSLAIVAAPLTTARADFLYHDIATTNGGQFNSSFPIGNLSNGGYTSATATEDASAAATNLSYATTNPPAAGYPVTITFEFDTPASLEAFHLWNHCNAGSATAVNQGVNAFTLDFYDGPGGSGSLIGSPFSANAAKAPASGTYPAETFGFPSPYAGVRSVVMTANNHNPSSNFVGMREVGFKGTRIPEPLPTPDKVIVYLVGGQSNADGYGVTSQLTADLQAPQPDIDFYHGNGLDDDWEELYWGEGNTGQDPGGDDDKDGLTNLQEFLWLTNPLVSNVVSPALQTSPDLSITWPSSPNRRYLIEVSPDLAIWERLDSFIPGSGAGSSSYLIPADPTAPLRFFRVGVHR